jgi:hypothetical protein
MPIIMAVVPAGTRTLAQTVPLQFIVQFSLFIAPCSDFFGCDLPMSLAIRVGNLASRYRIPPGIAYPAPFGHLGIAQPGLARRQVQAHIGASA